MLCCFSMKFSLISILVSLVGLVLILDQQYQLGIQYELNDGKTQAFYSVKSTLLSYKFACFGLFSILLSLFSWYKKEPKKLLILSFVLALIITIIPFTDLWKLWV